MGVLSANADEKMWRFMQVWESGFYFRKREENSNSQPRGLKIRFKELELFYSGLGVGASAGAMPTSLIAEIAKTNLLSVWQTLPLA